MIDKHQQSFIYWQFKLFKDITTCCSGESFYDASGNIYMDKVKALSRTYPQTIAGNSINYNFNMYNSDFEMNYSASSLNSNSDTIVYFNAILYYFNGVAIEIIVPDDYKNQISFKVTDGKYIIITSNFTTNDQVPIQVKVTECSDSNPTPCAFKNH